MLPLSEFLLKNLQISSYLLNKFSDKGVFSLSDLLYFFPLRHEDRRNPFSLQQAFEMQSKQDSEEQTNFFFKLLCVGRGKINFQGRSIQTFDFFDGSNEVQLAAFNPSHRFFKIDEEYFLAGKLKRKGNKYQLLLNEWERLGNGDSLNFQRWVPVYSLTEGLSQKQVRETLHQVFLRLNGKKISYNLPDKLVEKYRLSEKLTNIVSMHFPKDISIMERAKNELVYEEFYCLQEKLGRLKIIEKIGKKKNKYSKNEIWSVLKKKLPFELTPGQKQCLIEIEKDLNAPAVMRRMVQGDVGSGKTILALFILALASENGYQGALLVPTDILARQHFHFFSKILEKLAISVGLLVGSKDSPDNKLLREQIKTNEVKVVIGTHTLFQEEVEYFNLQLVVIDEQHRFGIEQRKKMVQKGNKVDCLMMSATPIPRSLSLTAFGDLDMSILKGKPKTAVGRKSKYLLEDNRLHAYKFMRQRVLEGEQGYVIFPLIKEDQTSSSHKTTKNKKSLLKEYKELKKKVFNDISVKLLHGQMSELEKQQVMESFLEGKVRILFSTTVLEVGLDVQNATVMIIESAEHFGLSQLHQLRGRVGRGEKMGYCYLIYGKKATEKTKIRLEKFTSIDDGFALSELDLELRGPGDFLGTRQSGQAKFRIGHLVEDYPILKRAREDALLELTNRLSGK